MNHFHVKFAVCKIGVAEFPNKIWFAVNVVVPIPPIVIDHVSNDTLDAFKEVNCEPLPTTLKAGQELLVLFHVIFAVCKIDVAEFPNKIWFAVNVVVPIPP